MYNYHNCSHTLPGITGALSIKLQDTDHCECSSHIPSSLGLSAYLDLILNKYYAHRI